MSTGLESQTAESKLSQVNLYKEERQNKGQGSEDDQLLQAEIREMGVNEVNENEEAH